MNSMEISSAISNATSSAALAAASHGLGFSSKLLLQSRRSGSQSPILSLPSSAAAPPVAVRSDPFRVAVAPRAFGGRTRHRTCRRSRTGAGGADDEDGGEEAFPGDGSGGEDDGAFGGGRGGWNHGDSSWDGGSEKPPKDESSSSDPAFGFVYEALCWIALSNCAHFALKKIALLLEEKAKMLPLRLLPLTC